MTKRIVKENFMRLAHSIATDDDFTAKTSDDLMRNLYRLKTFKTSEIPSTVLALSSKNRTESIPNEFLCPLSRQLMKEPVVICDGKTYDRVSIQKWIAEGNSRCPGSDDSLSNTIMFPNELVRDLISKWHSDHALEQKRFLQDPDLTILTDPDRVQFTSLLMTLSSSSSHGDKVAAAKELRKVTWEMPEARVFFFESADAIYFLLRPLSPGNSDPVLEEELITIIRNILQLDDNKKIVGKNRRAVSLVVNSLSHEGNVIKSKATASLLLLADLESNKELIGDLGAVTPLINFLDEESPVAISVVINTLSRLCSVHLNGERAISAGAIPVILDKIKRGVLVRQLVSLLALLLSRFQIAVTTLAEDVEAGPCLLQILRQSSYQRDKEKCVQCLLACCKVPLILEEIDLEQSANQTISKIVDSGTDSAKKYAMAILEMIAKT